MTDRELLELAAKAAGLRIWFGPDGARLLENGVATIRWNPLTNDGDALRLAVKLNLWEAVRTAHRLLGAPGGHDMYAATRRAIVRAAAAMGQEM